MLVASAPSLPYTLNQYSGSTPHVGGAHTPRFVPQENMVQEYVSITLPI